MPTRDERITKQARTEGTTTIYYPNDPRYRNYRRSPGRSYTTGPAARTSPTYPFVSSAARSQPDPERELDRFHERVQSFMAHVDQLGHHPRGDRENRAFLNPARSDENRADTAPIVIGFAIEPGQDGRPQFQQIGMHDDRPTVRRPHLAIDPITDLGAEDRIVGATLRFELPGVTKRDLTLETQGRLLRLNAASRRRSYETTVQLPTAADPSATSAQFQAGILTVTTRFRAPVHRQQAQVRVHDQGHRRGNR